MSGNIEEPFGSKIILTNCPCEYSSEHIGTSYHLFHLLYTSIRQCAPVTSYSIHYVNAQSYSTWDGPPEHKTLRYIYIYIYTASRFLRNPSAAAVSIKKQRAPCSAHVLVAVAYSRVRMSDEAVVQVHVPVVPQLLLPREILQRVHLAESTICFFNRVRREKNKLQLMRST